MENQQVNFDHSHTFLKGMTTDLDNHAESNETFYEGWNGRLISKDGILSFSSVTGTKKKYTNTAIKKYLGSFSFSDELIAIVKVDKKASTDLPIYVDELHLQSYPFTISGDSDIVGIDFLSHIEEYTIPVLVESTDVDEDDFNQSSSCVEELDEFDETYGGLFSFTPYTPISSCQLDANFVPIHNSEFADAIYSFKYNESGILTSTLLYKGNLNIPMNAKVVTFGVAENAFYKRVYFTDYYNSIRVINLKDQKLRKRTSEEISLFATATLLAPRVIGIEKNGQLPSMSVSYMMRLITENGQVTDFSPTSKIVKINKEDSAYEFSGGSPKELTNKSVQVKCYIPNWKSFQSVELIAIQYEAKSIPNSIRVVGRKNAAASVMFEHYGSEPEYTEVTTLADIFKNSLSWKYASDITFRNNKLFVCGLRNEPTFVGTKNIDLDFALHGFAEDGETHDCLLNSDPARFNYIDNEINKKFFSVRKKIYRTVEVFGSFSVKLINKTTGEFYEFKYINETNIYSSFTSKILVDLLEAQLLPSFQTKFPNLLIENSQGRILFKRINLFPRTDLSLYELVFSTSQVIVDMDNDLQLSSVGFPATDTEKRNRLVYGGVSNGWVSGNGIKVTMSSHEEEVLKKNTDWAKGSSPVLNLTAPSMEKYVMKGEIYRLGIQWYKNGNRTFTTILGDIKIPEIGQLIRDTDENGNKRNSYGERYLNHKVKDNTMYSQGIKLQFDVRVNCEFSKEVDSYQIVFVERTEENRTILAQGISAPLERLIPFKTEGNLIIKEPVANKWMLPSNGGPVYDSNGFVIYDNNPDQNDPEVMVSGVQSRMLTNRKMFYFDSPDFIHNKISSKLVEVSKMSPLFAIATDHDRFNIITGYNALGNGDGLGVLTVKKDHSYTLSKTYEEPFGEPKFSNKITREYLGLNREDENPYLVNISVFSKIINSTLKTFPEFGQPAPRLSEVKAARAFDNNEISSGYRMKDTFDVSNNAIALRVHGTYYVPPARNLWRNLFINHNIATGRETVMIKTKEDYFTPGAIGQADFDIETKVRYENANYSAPYLKGNDAHIISNVVRNNYDSVYGGRTALAYSRNEYIPMSDVIPIKRDFVSSQIFYGVGDTYTTLFVRNKTTYNGAAPVIKQNTSIVGKEHGLFNPFGAWCYAVVLETTVEPRLNYSDEFYRRLNGFKFNQSEDLNEAYLQENDIRKSIPKPYNFKDDPNLNNIVAASKVKLAGDFYDSFTQFLPNEFHELDKDKGTAFNFAKQEDQVYVIQENQTSALQIEEDRMINTDGKPIAISQGEGKSISGHSVISDYGTSIRRAVIESKFGFVFYDEKKKELVKLVQPMLTEANLSLSFADLFSNNKVMDVEGYYDDKYKETNIRFRTDSGLNFVLSYNELLKCFNGKIEYDNDIYMTFQEKILAPYENGSKLGELNSGNELNFFESQKDIIIGVVSAPDYSRTKIEKGLAININTNYPIDYAIFETSLNQIRTVLGTHHRYSIAEGIHTIPAVNMMDTTNIRGEWIKVLIKTKSLNNKKVNIFGIVNYLRNSYK